jgi:hypothetical protein
VRKIHPGGVVEVEKADTGSREVLAIEATRAIITGS